MRTAGIALLAAGFVAGQQQQFTFDAGSLRRLPSQLRLEHAAAKGADSLLSILPKPVSEAVSTGRQSITREARALLDSATYLIDNVVDRTLSSVSSSSASASLDKLLASDELGDLFETIGHSTESALNAIMSNANKGLRASHRDMTPGFHTIVHPDPKFAQYKVRFQEPTICDDTVQQYSGYLDISDTKHLFFWFFESRSSPSTDPMVLWLNGGPGCSSSTGLLFELGPCNVREGGEKLEYNPSSWNSKANVLFVDSPVQVGYSWSEQGDSVNNSPQTAEDLYALLQLFFHEFEAYASLPFTVAAESYGGIYAPNVASYIHKKNLELTKGLRSAAASNRRINLDTVMIGNGLTDALYQMPAVETYGCEEKSLFSPSTCESLKSKGQTCAKLVQACRDSGSRFRCIPANLYCWSNMYGPFQDTGLNPYDVRKKCDRNGEDGPLCYKEMQWIEVFLNKPETKKALGVPTKLEFQSCNMDVNRAFQFQGDSMFDAGALLVPLLKDGIRVIEYDGVEDFMCNWVGNEIWMNHLESPFTKEFAASKAKSFVTLEGKKAGTVRQAGPGAGNYTFVRLFDAGHMVPFNLPAESLDMFNRWLANIPLH
ncbi:uncharacterized protein L969DRAFT_88032 [Mixia osmundae IAM 14324]|uniref:Carboxypeptidase n=1 Tax=Mixia osmundae (strain CBS 9802 / IAM 14324 / JCM 22182 / KY 12970) TaxID=764103 RepID=G7E194_MIXOS|nr:uncharacterized protein L969DRAFT_88032 [Mixia osmundae IAM 14324]KEI38758.1 hypothetical protein L969DRAFT_88032 [Mixia osmundae IAM 14324]GAA96604.1 hypothetical protein E5Q_03274 [Mixia osmundae IAM 14324]